MRDHALALVNEEERYFRDLDTVEELLLELGPLLDRFAAEPSVREYLEEMRLDASAVARRYVSEDESHLQALREVRAVWPLDVPSALDDEGDPYLVQFDGWLTVYRESIAHKPGARDDREDPGKSAHAIFTLREALGDPARLPDLYRRVRAVEEDHEHAFRRFSMARRTTSGFSFLRLKALVYQTNPEPLRVAEMEAWFQSHLRIFEEPEFIQAILHGTGAESTTDTPRHKRLAAELRAELRRVCRELRRRIGSTRTRLSLLKTYALRCSWYNARAMADLAASLENARQKEDPLSDDLALFLFDNGLRPLTRAMVGRLVPDLIDPAPPTTPFEDAEVVEPAFYVEAKQYGDHDGALKALRDGARQIWSSAERIRQKYRLDEAFLVVFRRGGPLLVFPDGPTRSGSLSIRGILVDVAPGKESGSRQGDVIHVKGEQLLAEAGRAP